MYTSKIIRSDYSITVYPKKYAHGFVVLCFVVVTQSFKMNSHGVFIHIHLGCFAGTGAIVRLPQCQWSKPDGYGKISQCITTTKHSKAKTVCIFLGIYCMHTSTGTSHLLRNNSHCLICIHYLSQISNIHKFETPTKYCMAKYNDPTSNHNQFSPKYNLIAPQNR